MFSTAHAANGNGHLFQIFWGSDPVVKLTLLILISMSIVCWAIIVYKHKEINRLKESSLHFFESFLRSTNLDELLKKQARAESPLSNIFRMVLGDMNRKTPLAQIRRKVERAVDEEIERIERYIPFLATTGSSAPFIGLFGTVWGILAAFWQIGRAGSTSLAVVGPFIAEALIATAFGLAAAIPAVIFYNHFVNKIRLFSRDIESFGEDLVLRLEREYGT
ncbi:MAG: MotA/TolQ/ExbB proton channel family protein [Deltaproteobacteria bacterium]|nr:MotA/TolQ/ExbB proton channel family protein [Deltaproteobacteria bacterium]